MAERKWTSQKGSGKEVNVKWETEGQQIEGYYVSIVEGVGQEKNSSIHTFKTEEGEELVFWGSFVLDDQLSKVEFGTYAMVEYKGKKKTKSGSKSYHDFEVFTDDSAGTVTTEQAAPVASTTKQTAKAAASNPLEDGEEDDLPF